jgi:hypothetical protein
MNNRTTNQQAFTTAFSRLTTYPTGEQLCAARSIGLGTRALLAELEAVQQMDDFPRKEEAAAALQQAILQALRAQGIIRKDPAAETGA